MNSENGIDFSMGSLPPEETAADSRGGKDETSESGSGREGEAEPKPVFHTRKNSTARPGFHTRSGGYGAGIARGSAVAAAKKKKAAEEKATGKDLARLWLRAAVIAACIVAAGYCLIVIALRAGEGRGDLDVRKYADETAVTIDGEPMTFGDLTFYIMYEEMKVEQQAEIYNPDNTRDYWNILMNGVYLSARVKDMVMGMAVHDRIFYNEAVRAGITLSADEKQAMENRRTDFWEDLYPSQTEKLISSRDDINHVIYEIGLAEKYQQQLSVENNISYHSLDWNGKSYEKLRDSDHRVKVNKSLWHRFHMGNNTLIHGDANFVQGAGSGEDEEEEETLKDILFKSRD